MLATGRCGNGPALRGLRRTCRGRRVALAAIALVLAGCAGRPMMPAPNVYTSGREDALESVPAALRGNPVEVLYVTNRAPEPDADGNPGYGAGRSRSVAFGIARVALGDGVGWDALERDAREGTREEPIELHLDSFEERARGPAVPHPFTVVDRRPVLEPSVTATLETLAADLATEIRAELSRTRRKEVFVYVHGIRNSFADAVFATAELWHFLGREGVPIAFTWPAGGGGLVGGYVKDRESGEFAILHLKRMLKFLALVPEVERVSILAHSRGSDVVMTALRELFTEAWASGRHPADLYRLHNVVLAAPDFDFEVFVTRVGSEHVNLGMRRLTVYVSQRDQAIGAARALFGSSGRLGSMTVDQLPEDLRWIGRVMENVSVVEYAGRRGGAYGHGYFRENPAVSSDLVMLLRYDRAPGAENGRPLEQLGLRFWRLDDTYLAAP